MKNLSQCLHITNTRFQRFLIIVYERVRKQPSVISKKNKKTLFGNAILPAIFSTSKKRILPGLLAAFWTISCE